jgi:hypothetical protein
MTRPNTSVEMRSARRNTASMSCSTSSMVAFAAQALQQCHHALGFVRPHAGHGFVEQQQLGPQGQRQAHFKLALLAVRQRARQAVQLRAQPDALGHGRCAASYRARSLRAGCQKRRLLPLLACTASARLSSTERRLKTLVIWYERTSPRCTRACMGRPVMFWPPNQIVPLVGSSAPESW